MSHYSQLFWDNSPIAVPWEVAVTDLAGEGEETRFSVVVVPIRRIHRPWL
jgi:hypothetical protein